MPEVNFYFLWNAWEWCSSNIVFSRWHLWLLSSSLSGNVYFKVRGDPLQIEPVLHPFYIFQTPVQESFSALLINSETPAMILSTCLTQIGIEIMILTGASVQHENHPDSWLAEEELKFLSSFFTVWYPPLLIIDARILISLPHTSLVRESHWNYLNSHSKKCSLLSLKVIIS